jgi:biotin synthase
MEDWPPVDRGQWRRVQLARFLIDFCNARVGDMLFDDAGRVIDFGIDPEDLDVLIATGKPFRTSGCQGKDDVEVSACNRPFGDSSPTDILSFPFALAREDVEIVRRQLEGEAVGAGVIAED